MSSSILNLIDDVKEKLTDSEYKNIVDTLLKMNIEEKYKELYIFTITFPMFKYNQNEDGKPEILLFQDQIKVISKIKPNNSNQLVADALENLLQGKIIPLRSDLIDELIDSQIPFPIAEQYNNVDVTIMSVKISMKKYE